MDCDDFVVLMAIVLVVSFFLMFRSGMRKQAMRKLAAEGQTCGMRQAQQAREPPQRATQQAAPVAEHYNNRQYYEHASNNYSNGNNAATTGDAMTVDDLFPSSVSHMDADWKEMFSASENTLAQENFVEPSFEYSVGSINTPKRWLSQDLRGAPPVTQYDNLSIFNNSGYANVDLSEISTRRAGDL